MRVHICFSKYVFKANFSHAHVAEDKFKCLYFCVHESNDLIMSICVELCIEVATSNIESSSMRVSGMLKMHVIADMLSSMLHANSSTMPPSIRKSILKNSVSVHIQHASYQHGYRIHVGKKHVEYEQKHYFRSISRIFFAQQYSCSSTTCFV